VTCAARQWLIGAQGPHDLIRSSPARWGCARSKRRVKAALDPADILNPGKVF
jgi:hypothetical protein